MSTTDEAVLLSAGETRVFKRQRTKNGQTLDYQRWYVEFRDHRGTLQRIPGFPDRKRTEEFSGRLEQWIRIRTLNQIPPPALTAWIEQLPAQMLNRLSKLGIVDNGTTRNDSAEAFLMSADELADKLRVTERHVRSMDSCGQLPEPVRLGRAVRWRRDEIFNWIAAGCPSRDRWNAIKGRQR